MKGIADFTYVKSAMPFISRKIFDLQLITGHNWLTIMNSV